MGGDSGLLVAGSVLSSTTFYLPTSPVSVGDMNA